MLDFVRVLLGSGIDTLHALSFRRTRDSRLGGVDIVVDTIESTADDLSRETNESELDVVDLVHATFAKRVIAEATHCPSEWSLLLAHLGVHSCLATSDLFFVCEIVGFEAGRSIFLGVGGRGDFILGIDIRGGVVGGVRGEGLVHVLVLLDNGVVGDGGTVGLLDRIALEEGGAHDDHPPLDCGIALDDFGVHVGDEKEQCEESEESTSSNSDTSDESRGLLVQAELGGSLVDDREGADGSGDEEEEGRGVDGPWDGVLAHMDHELDQHEDGGCEGGGDGGGHS